MKFNPNYYLRKHQAILNLVFDFFTCRQNSPDKYPALVECLLSDPIGNLDPNHEFSVGWARFTKRDFMRWWESMGKFGLDGLDSWAVDNSFQALVDIDLLRVELNLSHSRDLLYCVGSPYLALLLNDRNLLFNRIFGFGYIANAYTPSVLKVENIKEGDHSIGNGFLIKHEGRLKLVTNHHVVAHADEIRVFTHDDQPIKFRLEKEDEKADLALLVLLDEPAAIPFRTWAGLQVLDEVLTIGYPPVNTQLRAHPIFHMGEINSHIEDYYPGNRFLFSAKANPGSSGGPIISHDGRVVGIVTNQFYDPKGVELGKLPYYAAIPAITIERFIGISSMPFEEFPILKGSI